MKNTSKILSAILSICMVLSVCATGTVFAGDDKVLMSWSGEDTITNLNGADLSDVMEVKEFQGEKVINFRTQKAGRVINYWSMTKDRKLNKHLSFKIYVPSTDYYFIDLRLASSRHSDQGVVSDNHTNTLSQFTFVTDAEKGRSIIGVKDGLGGSYVTKGIYGLDMWHAVDIYINDKTVSYYVDHQHVADTNIIGTGAYSLGFNNSFKGFQMCIGENNRTMGIEEGMYIKDVLLTSTMPELGSPVLNDNFENYAVDTEVSDGVDVTDITSGIIAEKGDVTRYNSFATIDPNYLKVGALGFKQLEDGNKVFVARNVPDHPRIGTGRDMRYGFWRSNAVDLNRGDITIEFDINIPDRSKLEGLIIQPFAQNAANGNLEAEINSGGVVAGATADEPNVWNNTGAVNARTAYASLLVPCASNSLFNLRRDGQIYFGGGVDAKNEFEHSKVYKEGEWTNLKFVISKEGEASYKTTVFVDNEYMGEQSTAKTAANSLQTAATDMVRGVRFMSAIAEAANPVEDLYYIDNFKMRIDETPEKISEVDVFRFYDDMGNEIDGEIAEGTEKIKAGYIIFKNRATSDNPRAIIAQYNENNVLISCNIEEINIASAENGTTVCGEIVKDVANGAKSVKAFVWSTDMTKPLH